MDTADSVVVSAADNTAIGPADATDYDLGFIGGWFLPTNRRVLERLIAEHNVQTVIEVGTFLGLSAAWFARRVKRVYCVDLWYEPATEPNHNNLIRTMETYSIPRDFYDLFEANMRRAKVWDRIVPIRGNSRVVWTRVPEVDLVYIDGDHSSEGCSEDIEHFGPKALKVVCGDDYVVCPGYGVQSAVQDYLPGFQTEERFWWYEKRRVASSQEIAEINYWGRTFKNEECGSPERWMARRAKEAPAMPFWSELSAEMGPGLDLGCGLVSILEEHKTNLTAVDPMLDEYDKIFFHRSKTTAYQRQDGESLNFPDASFDWILCGNVIDHTPHPAVLLYHALRVLKPGGRFYFWVNFDPELYAPHYHLWTHDTVNSHMRYFNKLHGKAHWVERHKKFVYFGVYQKPS